MGPGERHLAKCVLLAAFGWTLCVGIGLPSASQCQGAPAVGEDETERRIKSLVQSAPAEPEALLLLGDYYVAKGRTKEAKDQYAAVIALQPGGIVGYVRMAFLLLEVERDETAASSLLEQASARSPQSPELHALLGQSYLSLAFHNTAGEPETRRLLDLAAAELAKALASTAGDDLRASIHLALGAAFQRRCELSGSTESGGCQDARRQAEAHYRQAFALHPAYRDDLVSLEAELAFPRQAIEPLPPELAKAVQDRLRRLEAKLKHAAAQKASGGAER